MKTLQPRTKEAVLAIAGWQVGIMESPANSNKVKYNTWYYGREVSGSAYPWCMAFIQWVFHEAGFNLYKTASCTALANRYKAIDPAKKQGCWVTKGFKPGDIIMFDFSGKKSKTEHVGILDSIDKEGNLVVIEGNTSLNNQSNGGAVMRRLRNPIYVTGACRPGYNM